MDIIGIAERVVDRQFFKEACKDDIIVKRLIEVASAIGNENVLESIESLMDSIMRDKVDRSNFSKKYCTPTVKEEIMNEIARDLLGL